ncbi:sigma-70 family RNA polymerase sigma factor [Tautonia rosea]|uniref:sigma-70 family RNA polymerase sigma factor n=1 Tax=Tautonia rosea TaxID=2728037 RepID=UPI00147584ED|nr:sigma-70 family RNA polymerase sigma factor [Tautonia rosea]
MSRQDLTEPQSRTPRVDEPEESSSGNGNVDPDSWVDRHGDVLYRWAVLRLGDHESAADVVQETFLAALDHRMRFDARSSERTWLLGILKHKIGDVLRRRRRESVAATEGAERPERESFGEPFDRRGFWVRGPSRWEEPGLALESAEFWEQLRKCLGAMPEHLAETFLLREVEGVDGPEVCRDLAITPESFWKRMHRARLLLRECLELRWFGTR